MSHGSSVQPTTGAGLSLAGMAVGRAVTQTILIASALVIPAVMGPRSYGAFASVMSIVAISDVLASGGMHIAEMRYFGARWSRSRNEAIELGSTILASRLVLAVLAAVLAFLWLRFAFSHVGGTFLVGSVAAMVFLRGALDAARQPFLSMSRAGVTEALGACRGLLILAVVVLVFPVAGLDWTFFCLACGMLALFLVGITTLLRAAPLSLRTIRIHHLRYLVPFSAVTLVGVIAWGFQSHFTIYVIGNWVSLDEAALVGLTIQLYVMAQTFVITPWSAVLPTIAQLYDRAEIASVKVWTSVIMRYGVFISVVGAVTWSLLGPVVLLPLHAAFAPVYEAGVFVLLAVVFLVVGTTANNLVYMGGSAIEASLNTVLFAAMTVVGTFGIVAVGVHDITIAVGQLYVIASVAYAFVAYVALGRRQGIWLSLRRPALLLTPLVALVPLVQWAGDPLQRFLASLVFLSLYPTTMVISGLLPWAEVRQALLVLRRALTPGVNA